ncbi:hypothetical protein [Modicisalibacter xianhensis]|uniref:Uncharacterized protein n=1 Tax=Modicisalibacter xianhensis TaxID=442341 RepID=A0A1I3E8K4_9GAMM|nr:hypothetical protein [Halomonas xianhensis]SFH95218.1 hypothetical protein SAMN04487959_11328 [Halomonas xianhensis]
MTTAPIAFTAYGKNDYGYGAGYWRFSVARSVQSAASGRGILGGTRQSRCLDNQ